MATDPDPQSTSAMIWSPLKLLKFAQEQVPAVKYATGLVGIAAALTLIYTLLPGVSAAGIGTLILYALIAMLILFLVATAVRVSSEYVRAPALALLWATCILIIVFMAFTVTAFAVGWPRVWAYMILPEEIQRKTFVEAAGIVAPQPEEVEDEPPEDEFEDSGLTGNWNVQFNRINGPSPGPWFSFDATIAEQAGQVEGTLSNDQISGEFSCNVGPSGCVGDLRFSHDTQVWDHFVIFSGAPEDDSRRGEALITFPNGEGHRFNLKLDRSN